MCSTDVAQPMHVPITAPMLQMLPSGVLIPAVRCFKRTSVTPVLGKGETQLMFFGSDDDTKAMTIRLNNNGSFVLHRFMVCCFFDIPCVEVARIMCISLSLLKRIRSWARLDCWPCSLIHSREHPQFTREWVVHRRDEIIASLENKFMEQPCSALGLTVGILKNVRQYAATYLRLVIPGTGRRNHGRNVTSGQKNVHVEETDDKKFKIKVRLSLVKAVFRPGKAGFQPGKAGFQPGKAGLQPGKAGFQPGKKETVVRKLTESMLPGRVTVKRAKVTDESEVTVKIETEVAETKAGIGASDAVVGMDTAITAVVDAADPPMPQAEDSGFDSDEFAPFPHFCQAFNTDYVDDVEDELGLGPVIIDHYAHG